MDYDFNQQLQDHEDSVRFAKNNRHASVICKIIVYLVVSLCLLNNILLQV